MIVIIYPIVAWMGKYYSAIPDAGVKYFFLVNAGLKGILRPVSISYGCIICFSR